MNRREFLNFTLLSTSAVMLFGRTGWAARASDNKTYKRLVVVLLRGAIDGLNVVTPYSDGSYYTARPTIAIPRPGQSDGALRLDSHFALHPSLSPLMSFWEKRSLAFVHASGSPDTSRSHFDAQDYMETATPGQRSTPDGWLNRLLETLPGTRSATDGLSVGPTMPRILSGKMPTTNLTLGKAGTRAMALDRPEIAAAFDRLYSGSDALSLAYREGQEARTKLLAQINEEMTMADNGAPSAIGFSDQAQKLGRLVARDPAIKIAFFALGGWDTHINEGSVVGQLSNRLRGLGETLSAFASALGPAYDDTVIMVLSEFGRTVHENGNSGTDHGHGNVIWLMGGQVNGGKIYGQWPGLSGNDLHDGRDLAVTTDFRQVIGAVLESQFSLTSTQLNKVLPTSPSPEKEQRDLIRA